MITPQSNPAIKIDILPTETTIDCRMTIHVSSSLYDGTPPKKFLFYVETPAKANCDEMSIKDVAQRIALRNFDMNFGDAFFGESEIFEEVTEKNEVVGNFKICTDSEMKGSTFYLLLPHEKI